MKKLLIIPLIAMSYLTTAAGAYAQNCYNLDDNPVWLQYFQEFNEQIQAGDNNAALQTTEKLQEICRDSPLLNYAISRVYRNLGDHISELEYLQRATTNAPKFNVREKTLKKFWFARYEAEHPEIVASKTQLEENNQTMKDLNEALKASERSSELMQVKLQHKEENIYKAMMWSGAVVGGVGVAMTIAGGVLMGDKKKRIEEDINNNKVRIKNTYEVSLGILGAGIAATITGAMAAGFGGYLYSNKKSEENLSFQITPANATLTYSF